MLLTVQLPLALERVPGRGNVRDVDGPRLPSMKTFTITVINAASRQCSRQSSTNIRQCFFFFRRQGAYTAYKRPRQITVRNTGMDEGEDRLSFLMPAGTETIRLEDPDNSPVGTDYLRWGTTTEHLFTQNERKG